VIQHTESFVSEKAQRSLLSLPALVIEPGKSLFSANQASRFLFPPQKGEYQTDQWLEWDASQLQVRIVQPKVLMNDMIVL